MKRRSFARLATLSALAVSTSGFVRFNGRFFEGDCQTTSDILGPFYRPGSPERTNLVIPGTKGDIIELAGVVRGHDCKTPYRGAKIELWHCSSEEVYDNDSDEFRYRGTTYSDQNGKYHFVTQMPVPYDDGGGNMRPAHLHLMISVPGYDSFITQIYFGGDPFLNSDPFSASSKSGTRIISVKEVAGRKHITFDATLRLERVRTYDSFDQIAGRYRNDKSGKFLELFSDGSSLWLKNIPYGIKYVFISDNTFEYPGMPPDRTNKMIFDLTAHPIKLTLRITRPGENIERHFTKE